MAVYSNSARSDDPTGFSKFENFNLLTALLQTKNQNLKDTEDPRKRRVDEWGWD